MLRVGLWAAVVLLAQLGEVSADCWLIEGEKGYVWLAICSQNQPPYEAIPQHINSTVQDLRLNENKLKVLMCGALSRFGNLTDLNLTKNEIGYIEDGAFVVQSNLRTLQLGYNKLTNLTESMLRGLARLEFLYVQHNLIESISVNAFLECAGLLSIDLSANKLAKVETDTFSGLSLLTVCELAGNPFHCSCELLGFLSWLAFFNNVTRTYDRLQCETPPEFAGFPLLSPTAHGLRNAIGILGPLCKDGKMPTAPSFLNGSDNELSSGGNPSDFSSAEPAITYINDNLNGPSIKLHQIGITAATLMVHIPSPYSKMYILVQYNNSFVSDVTTLNNKNEYIKLEKLRTQTNYTFCVASIQKSQRFNHTCLTFATKRQDPRGPVPNASTTTHYIMTILGCLFGMVIVLGVVYYCLRKRRIQEEKQKSINVKKTILEMRYGPESESSGMLHSLQKLHEQPGTGPRLSTLPSAPGDKGTFKPLEVNETPKGTKGNYIEVRTAESSEHRDEETRQAENGNGQGSSAEISTIAKEVDKVNQLINNCIDVLKLDSASFIGADSEVSIDRQLTPSTSMSQLERPGLLSPRYKEGAYPLQRQSSADTSRKRCSISSSGSAKSARVFSLDLPEQPGKAEAKYIEQSVSSPSPLERFPLVGPSDPHRLEVQQYHCSEHRHSFPALYYEEHGDSLSHRAALLKPLSRTKRDSTYSQLSPRHHQYSGYSSSPEYSSENTHKIWERFRPYKKHPREEVYMAAGHALRKKVQFAKDEDLHDILDYWKGVSAQQKL